MTISRKATQHIATFTDRERRIYEYLLKGFSEAVDDLRRLGRDAHDYRERLTRIDDRISNFAFTAREMNIELNYESHSDYKVLVTLWA